MNYWWVNHKQTHKMEIEGGYIWSPKTSKGGIKNQTYINLTGAQVNDLVFSYADGEIKAIGIVAQNYVESPKPPEFGETGNQWADDGWLVKIDWQLLEKPFRPKNIIDQVVPLLPTHYSPIQKNGNGNQSCYLANINENLGSLILLNIEKDNIEISSGLTDAQTIITDNNIEKDLRWDNIPETEKEQLIKARYGQGIFRIRLEKIEHQCRITGVEDKRLLVASHIKPWRDSDNMERLDGYNGLLLSPHVDKLFDKGWISFTDQGRILCGDRDIRKIMEKWGLDPSVNVGDFKNKQKFYLGYHRHSIYKFR